METPKVPEIDLPKAIDAIKDEDLKAKMKEAAFLADHTKVSYEQTQATLEKLREAVQADKEKQEMKKAVLDHCKHVKSQLDSNVQNPPVEVIEIPKDFNGVILVKHDKEGKLKTSFITIEDFKEEINNNA